MRSLGEAADTAVGKAVGPSTAIPTTTNTSFLNRSPMSLSEGAFVTATMLNGETDLMTFHCA